jgi:hypothetical protein
VSLAFLTLAALVLASCVTPSCWKHAYLGFSPSAKNRQSFARIIILSQPLTDSDPFAEPRGRAAATYGLGVWFGHTAVMSVDSRGAMYTTDESSWPEGCVTVRAEELATVSRSWEPMIEPDRAINLERMEHPFTDESWRPYGPLISLTFGSIETNLGLLWDGQSSLPEDLDAAVMRTLEMFCSNGRKARKILHRDLPQQLVARLECAR